jgi:hypothetical protein
VRDHADLWTIAKTLWTCQHGQLSAAVYPLAAAALIWLQTGVGLLASTCHSARMNAFNL